MTSGTSGGRLAGSLAGSSDQVSARQPGVDVQAGGAQRVVVEPDRARPPGCWVAVDRVIRGSGAVLAIEGVPVIEPIAGEPGIRSAVELRRHLAAVQVNDRPGSGRCSSPRLHCRERRHRHVIPHVGFVVERVGPMQRLVGAVLVGQHVGGGCAAQVVDELHLGRLCAVCDDHRARGRTSAGLPRLQVAPHPCFRHSGRQYLRLELGHLQLDLAGSRYDGVQRWKRVDELRDDVAGERNLRRYPCGYRHCEKEDRQDRPQTGQGNEPRRASHTLLLFLPIHRRNRLEGSTPGNGSYYSHPLSIAVPWEQG